MCGYGLAVIAFQNFYCILPLSKEDSNLYSKVEHGNPVILLLYVDDMFVTCMDGLIADTKRKLAIEFEIKDLGMMHYF